MLLRIKNVSEIKKTPPNVKNLSVRLGEIWPEYVDASLVGQPSDEKDFHPSKNTNQTEVSSSSSSEQKK